IYKSVGALLIKTKGKSEITKELKSNKESLELRKTTLDQQEGRTKEKLTELQSKVQNALSGSEGQS
ncbi:MAG: prefoldin subunit, partial [Thermoplasmatales archaeon]|nr:prefoldin subunit [Thermoplasmatales archaeon]